MTKPDRSDPHLRLRVAAVAVALLLGSAARAQTADTLAAADRLLTIQDVPTMMREVANGMIGSMPGASPAQRQALAAELTKAEFIARMRERMRAAMARHFSVEELNALSEFYARPVARSAMAKMGPYTAEFSVFLQTELASIIQRLQKIQ